MRAAVSMDRFGTGKIRPTTDLLARSDVIVLAVARDFISNADAAGPAAKVVIDPLRGRVRFEVLETLKGLGHRFPA